MKRILLATLLLIGISTTYADSGQQPWYYGHGYVEGQIGMGQIQTPTSGFSNYSVGGFAWRVAGGYLLGQGHFNYGLELGYTGLPTNSYGAGGIEDTFNAGDIDLLFVGRYNFTDHWNIYGKFGPDFSMQKFAEPGGVHNYSKTFVLPKIGGGVGYQINQTVGLNLEADYAFGKSPSNVADLTQAVLNQDGISTLSVLFGVNISF
tara:strand:+ start:37510 stop:38124 length:615 start_codon:yes stop_codon:yes gene_type:complete